MNTIFISHAGNEKYYELLGREDYYTAEVDPCGTFQGKGAKRLNIENEKIETGDTRLKHLFRGYSPDGTQKLRQNAYKGNDFPTREYKIWTYTDPKTNHTTKFRSKKLIPEHLKPFVKESTEKRGSTTCYDNVLSAPKYVSILWALAPNEQSRTKIHQAHIKAVEEARNYLENNALFIRRGAGGKTREKAEGVFATFHHTTSRALDPQLHTHLVVMNVGFNKDGKSGALDGEAILDHRYAVGMVYQNALRREMEQEFGVKTYDIPFSDGKGVTFGIKGISHSLKNEFSRRSLDIQKRTTEDMTPLEVRKEVLASRKDKQLNIQTKDLISAWKARVRKHNFEWEKCVTKPHNWERCVTQTHKPQKPAPESINQKVATHLQRFPSPVSRYPKNRICEPQILVATLSASKGNFSTKASLKIAENFTHRFTRKASNQPQSRKLTQFTLTKAAHRLIDFKAIKNRLVSLVSYVLKWHKVKRRDVLKNSRSQNSKNFGAFKRKITFLYATGQISRKQYLKLTTYKKLPTSKFKIHLYEALGIISKRQAYRALNQNHYHDFWGKYDPQKADLTEEKRICSRHSAYSTKSHNTTQNTPKFNHDSVNQEPQKTKTRGGYTR